MNVTGFTSPHKDDVIETNDRCDPTKTSYVEFADCGGAVLDEQPAKMAEAIRLFLQGLGHSTSTLFAVVVVSFLSVVPHLSIPRFSIANRLTEQAVENKRRNIGSTRRQSVPFDSADSALYPNESDRDHEDEDADQDENFSDELQLRVDSFEDRNIKL